MKVSSAEAVLPVVITIPPMFCYHTNRVQCMGIQYNMSVELSPVKRRGVSQIVITYHFESGDKQEAGLQIIFHR